MVKVKLEQVLDVQVRNAIAIGKHERFIIAQPALEPLQPSPGLRVQAGIYKVDFPLGLIASIADRGFPGGQVDRDVVVERVEVQELLLDRFALVPQGDNKLGDP